MSGAPDPVPADDETCALIRLAATASIDGEASDLETAIVRRHVAACADCRAVLDGHRAVARRVREAPLEQPRRGVLPRRRQARYRRALATLVIAASLGAGALAGALISDAARSHPSVRTRTVPVIAERPGPGQLRPAG